VTLKFHAVSTSHDSGIYHLDGFFKLPFVVDSDFSNDKRWLIVTNQAIT